MFKGVLIKKDVLRLFILASFAGIIGVWGIINTAMISRDGVFWVENARALEASESIFGCFRAAISKIENPGLPLMIFGWNRLLSRLGLGRSNLDWVLAGQTLVLLCRILSLVPLYYLGKLLVGRRHAFWAILILIFLPWPAEWGHDVLREWPHLLFLSSSLLMVFLAFTSKRMFFLLPAGLLAGLGHVIRPECAQVVVYALVGLGAVLWNPREIMTRKKAILGALFLMLGFAIIFVPYAQMRREIFPLKMKKLLTNDTVENNIVPTSVNDTTHIQHAGFLPASMKGVMNFIQTLCENLYYYYFPFWLIGLYVFFRHLPAKHIDKWFIASLIILNFLIFTALYYEYGYISRRHLLPLAAVTVFLVPLGMASIARLLSAQKNEHSHLVNPKKQILFFLGMSIVGILVCLPKATKPLGTAGYRKTAEYLKKNTSHNAIIAVPDKRITFYADRDEKFYKKQPVRGHWDYLVAIEKQMAAGSSEMSRPLLMKVFSCPLKVHPDPSQIVVYRQPQKEQ